MDIGMNIRFRPVSLPVASRYAKWFFIALLFVALGFGLPDWYVSAYRSDWTEEERQAYIDSTFQGTVFDEASFRKAVEAVAARAEAYDADRSDTGTDIFAPSSD